MSASTSYAYEHVWDDSWNRYKRLRYEYATCGWLCPGFVYRNADLRSATWSFDDWMADGWRPSSTAQPVVQQMGDGNHADRPETPYVLAFPHSNMIDLLGSPVNELTQSIPRLPLRDRPPQVKIRPLITPRRQQQVQLGSCKIAPHSILN